MDIHEKITKELNRQSRTKIVPVKLLTIQEILNIMDYLESLEEKFEYIEETPVKKLKF